MTEPGKRAQLAFKIILSFSAKLRLRSILGKTFLAGFRSTTIHLPSREVLEPITGSFILSAQLDMAHSFLIRPCKYSASRLQGPLFQFFTNAFVFFCRMGTVGDVKLKVCIHVNKSFLIVCV